MVVVVLSFIGSVLLVSGGAVLLSGHPICPKSVAVIFIVIGIIMVAIGATQ